MHTHIPTDQVLLRDLHHTEPKRLATFFQKDPPSRPTLLPARVHGHLKRWIIHTCSFNMPNIHALCGGTRAFLAVHLFPNVTRHLWIIPPECIIDAFHLSCRSMFDLSRQASQAGCIVECTLWLVSVLMALVVIQEGKGIDSRLSEL